MRATPRRRRILVGFFALFFSGAGVIGGAWFAQAEGIPPEPTMYYAGVLEEDGRRDEGRCTDAVRTTRELWIEVIVDGESLESPTGAR